MTDTIEPALTADEWEAWKAGRLRGTTVECLRRPAFALALFNAEMPDDDPRKITRRDVYILQKAAEFIDDTEDVDGPLSTYVRSIAAKLAALLPPDA